MHSVTVAQSNSFDTHSGVSLRALQPDISDSVGVEPKLELDRGATKRLERICRYLRYITDQCRVRTLCGHVNFVVGSGNPTNVRGKRGVRATRLNRNRALGGQIFASSQGVENVEVSIVQGLVEQFSQSVFWLWSEQGGPATCSGACECSARCWIKYDTSAVAVCRFFLCLVEFFPHQVQNH